MRRPRQWLAAALFAVSASAAFGGVIFDDPPKTKQQLALEAWQAQQNELWWQDFWTKTKNFGIAAAVVAAFGLWLYFFGPMIWNYIRARTIVTKKELKMLRTDLPHFKKLSNERYDELEAEKAKVRAYKQQNADLRRQIEQLGAPAAESIESVLKKMEGRYGL